MLNTSTKATVSSEAELRYAFQSRIHPTLWQMVESVFDTISTFEESGRLRPSEDFNPWEYMQLLERLLRQKVRQVHLFKLGNNIDPQGWMTQGAIRKADLTLLRESIGESAGEVFKQKSPVARYIEALSAALSLPKNGGGVQQAMFLNLIPNLIFQEICNMEPEHGGSWECQDAIELSEGISLLHKAFFGAALNNNNEGACMFLQLMEYSWRGIVPLGTKKLEPAPSEGAPTWIVMQL